MGSTPHRPGPRRSLRSKLMATAIVVAAPLLLSMPIALADCPVTDPECLTSTAGQVAGTVIASPTPDPGGTVDQAVQQAKDAAGGAVKQVTDTVDGLLGGGSGGDPGGDPGGGPGGNGGHGSRTPGPLGGRHSGGSILKTGPGGTSAPGIDASSRPASARVSGGDRGLLGRLGGAAAEAAKQLTFPVLLALIVFLFLLMQNEMDRQDPKLALAPIKPDVMRFE